jgi:hypothetical protein
METGLKTDAHLLLTRQTLPPTPSLRTHVTIPPLTPAHNKYVTTAKGVGANEAYKKVRSP